MQTNSVLLSAQWMILVRLAFVLSGILSFSGPATAGGERCVANVCVKETFRSNLLFVSYRVTSGDMTHVNILSRALRDFGSDNQIEGGRSGRFDLAVFPGEKYMIQLCNRGGLLQRSSCGGWRIFHIPKPPS